mmetsp:Transcript_4057/g.5824  ORF Transcript_4057/g.5824 Transcript_4057/m.5824 type:complete len:319 (-) Transcript_4057:402-1358(-)
MHAHQNGHVHHHHTGDDHDISKRRVKAACTNCKKAKARCDQQRPCSRCVERGCTECVDAFPRRVGRRRNHFFTKIVTETEVKHSGEFVQPTKTKKRRRRTKAKRTRQAEKSTPPLKSKKLKIAKNVKPLNLETSNDSNLPQLPLLRQCNDFSLNMFTLPQLSPNSADHVLGSPRDACKSFEFQHDNKADMTLKNEGLSNLGATWSNKTADLHNMNPGIDNFYGLKGEQPQPLLPLDLPLELDPVPKTESHSDTSSETSGDGSALNPMEKIGSLDLVPSDDFHDDWMTLLGDNQEASDNPITMSNDVDVFGMDLNTILC